MRIAVCATGPGPGSGIDPRLGRCAWFVIVDPDTGEQQSVPNESASGRSGVGVRVVHVLQELKVNAVLADKIGPNAARALAAADIAGYTGASGTVEDGIRQFQAGQLTSVADPGAKGGDGNGAGNSG